MGSKVNQSCNSDLRGASFTTSEVSIKENVLTNWDGGFDDNDNQLWDSELGAHIIININISH